MLIFIPHGGTGAGGGELAEAVTRGMESVAELFGVGAPLVLGAVVLWFGYRTVRRAMRAILEDATSLGYDADSDSELDGPHAPTLACRSCRWAHETGMSPASAIAWARAGHADE